MFCDCGHDAVSYSIRLTARGRKTVCRNCQRPKLRESAANPFADLTLEHVHGHDDRPLHVTSLRDLRRAEKEFKFKSLVANERECDFDKPPQKEAVNLCEAMDEAGLYSYPEAARAMIKELRDTGEIASRN